MNTDRRIPSDPPSSSFDDLVFALRDARFSGGVTCPRCGSPRIQRWGTFSGRQRYRCVGECGRTFSDLTGTPAAYVKKLHLWQGYGRCLSQSLSVRASARAVGVHPSTAFRWRHRILGWLAAHDREHLSGWVEVGLVRIPKSEKGSRSLGRAPRRRGVQGAEWWSSPRASVVVACDRRGAVVSGTLPGEARRPRPEHVDAVLRDRLLPTRPPARIITQRAFPLEWDAVAALVSVPRGPPRTGHAHLEHRENLDAYCRRLRRWLGRFHGVATRYLDHYLGWHRAIDAEYRRGIARVSLRWPLELGR
jgi:transposase-like protein